MAAPPQSWTGAGHLRFMHLPLIFSQAKGSG